MAALAWIMWAASGRFVYQAMPMTCKWWASAGDRHALKNKIDERVVASVAADAQIVELLRAILVERFGCLFIELEIDHSYDGMVEFIANFRQRGFGRRRKEAIALATVVIEGPGAWRPHCFLR